MAEFPKNESDYVFVFLDKVDIFSITMVDINEFLYIEELIKE